MKPAEESPHPPGGTTIEELERFRQDIERYRARRKAITDEFEGFVRSFKKPVPATPQPPTPVVRASPPPQSDPPMTPAAVPVREPAPARPISATEVKAPVVETPAVRTPALQSPVARTPEVHTPVVSTPPAQPPVARAPVIQAPVAVKVPAAATRPRRSLVTPILVLAGIAILAAVWLWPGGRGAESTPATPPSAAGPAPASSPAPPAPTPAPAVAPASPESELTTTRAVWLRVTVDGTRVVNRELPAGSRVALKAEKAIEIRTGDAGAVRLSIRGRDQGALGRDGEVVTRSFTVPPR